jgi:hypothetical protein
LHGSSRVHPIADVLVETHKELDYKTKTALAQATARATEAAAKAADPLPVSNTAQLRDLAQSAARIFGWGESGMTVHANQALIVTQEQLGQIRQLRGVPEPEQLQERKSLRRISSNHVPRYLVGSHLVAS